MPPSRDQNKSPRVMIFSDRVELLYPLEVRLRHEGFQFTTCETLETFVASCKRFRPDIIIIKSSAKPRDVVNSIKHLTGKGINVSSIPTFLLVRSCVAFFLTPLLEIGIEDIVDLDENLDVLIQKMREVRARIEPRLAKAANSSKKQACSQGNLADMSIIDLLQALGPGQRTARITVRPDDDSSDPLLMYLVRGCITYAKLGDLIAEQAIYRALAWEHGTWELESVTDADLPAPNNTLPNEFILMEGCRLLDENSRKSDENKQTACAEQNAES